MQPIWTCQQKHVNFTVRCKKYAENAVKYTVYLLYIQFVVLCMFLQNIGLKNCVKFYSVSIVNFYMHLLYFFFNNVNFTGVVRQIGCQCLW